MNKRITIYVYGRVQGVFYRFHTKRKAKSLNLRGWVKNQDDGGVKILAEGKKQDLETFLLWCRRGPPFAKVNNISHEWTNIASDKFDSFKITY